MEPVDLRLNKMIYFSLSEETKIPVNAFIEWLILFFFRFILLSLALLPSVFYLLRYFGEFLCGDLEAEKFGDQLIQKGRAKELRELYSLDSTSHE